MSNDANSPDQHLGRLRTATHRRVDVRVEPDHVLMALVAQRRHSDAAMAELHRRHAHRLCGALRHRFHDAATAEDAVQETFVRAWRHAHSFDPASGSVSGWLRAIAMRAAVDLFRRRGRSVVASVPLAQEPSTNDRATPDGAAEPAVVLEMVLDDALAALSTEHREVLHHAYRGDLSQSQIAARLGVPLGTVKTRTFWALAAMRRALGPAFELPMAAA